jgi:hypothetical protein
MVRSIVARPPSFSHNTPCRNRDRARIDLLAQANGVSSTQMVTRLLNFYEHHHIDQSQFVQSNLPRPQVGPDFFVYEGGRA